MKSLLLIPFFLMLFMGCKSSDKHSSNFMAISIVTADKITKSGGITSIDSTWAFKIYNNNYSIYSLPKIVFKESRTKLKGDTVNLEFSNADTTYRYFIVKHNDNIGLEYDKDVKNAKQFSVDSLLQDIGIHQRMFGIYNLKLGKPTNIEKQGSNIIVEKYFKEKEREGDSDSIYRYFDKRLVGIDFSYSPLLDKEKNSKLFKSSFINVYRGKDIKDKIIRTEYYGEFKEVKIDNPKLLENIIEKYEKDVKAIKQR